LWQRQKYGDDEGGSLSGSRRSESPRKRNNTDGEESSPYDPLKKLELEKHSASFKQRSDTVREGKYHTGHLCDSSVVPASGIGAFVNSLASLSQMLLKREFGGNIHERSTKLKELL